jgi:hypothetical protein
MAVQESVAVRNAKLDASETTVGTAPHLRIRTGAQPANCAAARSGTVLADITLPSDWMANASGGAKAQLGTWSDSSADASGTAAHWEIMESTLTTCHFQGTVTGTGGGGDIELLTTAIIAGMSVGITSFTLTEGNA